MGKGKEKATNAIAEERTSMVIDFLLAGYSPKEIFRFVSAGEFEGRKFPKWGVTQRQVENYIREANKILKALASADREAEFSKAHARLNMLYQKAFKIQDYKTCLAVQKELNVLFGNNKINIDHNVEISPIKSFQIIPASAKPKEEKGK